MKVAEYRYNGLNERITSHQDTDTDGDVDANDTILHFVYDEGWRVVAVFEDDDSAPHEEFVHHNAGMDGFGGSSYIDDVVFRDRDADGDFSHTLEERIYYCQNWRHDVVALMNDAGELIEQVRYSPYGVPFGYPTGDTNSDGDWDGGDAITISSPGGGYTVRKDANLDGVVNSSDVTHANSITGGYQTLGRTVLTSMGVESILGYAGYVHDAKLAGAKWHVRYRVLDSELGRWLTRDPWGYVITANLYEYAPSLPQSWVDPFGLFPMQPRGPMKVPSRNAWTLTFPFFSPMFMGTGGGSGSQPDGTGAGGDVGGPSYPTCPTCSPNVPTLPPFGAGNQPMAGFAAAPAIAACLATPPCNVVLVGGVAVAIIWALWPKQEWAHVAGDICIPRPKPIEISIPRVIPRAIPRVDPVPPPPVTPKRCRPCNPPVGTVAVRYVDPPGSKPHGPIPAPHAHLSVVNQSPYPACVCFWNNLGVIPGDGSGLPGPPLPPLTGGGPAN